MTRPMPDHLDVDLAGHGKVPAASATLLPVIGGLISGGLSQAW